MTSEKQNRTARTQIMLTPKVKEQALIRAEQERRSLSDYIFQLIVDDIEKNMKEENK